MNSTTTGGNRQASGYSPLPSRLSWRLPLWWWVAAGVIAILAVSAFAPIAVAAPGEAQTRQLADAKLRQKIAPVLAKYCPDMCEIVAIRLDVEESLNQLDNLGFDNPRLGDVRDFSVSSAQIEIQIDDRVGEENRRRLKNLISINGRSVSPKVQVAWLPFAAPQISPNADAWLDQDLSAAELMKKPEVAADYRRQRVELRRKISQTVKGVLARYCPERCLLKSVDLTTALITAPDAELYRENQVFFQRNKPYGLKIGGVEVGLLVDSGLSEGNRANLQAVVSGALGYVSPVEVKADAKAFPESFARRSQREQLESSDPYGLEKLKNMLTMFKELAGTKEIITNNTSTSEKTSESTAKESSSTTSSTAKESTSQTSLSEKNLLEKNSSSKVDGKDQGFLGRFTNEEILGYSAGALVLIALLLVFISRFSKAKKDASEMMLNMSTLPAGGAARGAGTGHDGSDMLGDGGQGGGSGQVTVGAMSEALRLSQLKNELIKLFLDNPKVAKETFSRLLKEDGVEETAKYVAIFGHLIVFELLGDPSLHRDLYELSEYYHRSSYNFSIADQLELLGKLKTRCTASEIKVLATKSTDNFEFLNKLAGPQIYKLIYDEKINVQAIALTQLDRKRRRSVFDLYQGDTKILLLSELSKADTIPKEFLYNVAKVLKKKVQSSPEFDAENLRTSDILLDLLEKAQLVEQKSLMATLAKNNPDTARSLKTKLVSIQLLPYLKDGHLLELFLGMEQEDLLSFLAGTEEHIRELIIDKAPAELAESWQEDLMNFGGVDEQTFRQKEIQVLNRVRNMANNGTINLLDINERIFEQEFDDSTESDADMPPIATLPYAS